MTKATPKTGIIAEDATPKTGIIAEDATPAKTEKKQPPRPRNWFLVSYLPLEAIKLYLNRPNVSRYAMIRHDKDVEADGKPVTPHWHILIVFQNGRTFRALEKDFAPFKALYNENTFFEACDVQWAYSYLTHSENPEKYQYSPADIICDDAEYWSALAKGEKPNRCYEMMVDILSGKNPCYLLRRYGRDYVLNARKYYEFAEAIGTVNEDEYEALQQVKREAREKQRAIATRSALNRLQLIEDNLELFDEPPVYDNGLALGYETCPYFRDEDWADEIYN